MVLLALFDKCSIIDFNLMVQRYQPYHCFVMVASSSINHRQRNLEPVHFIATNSLSVITNLLVASRSALSLSAQ